MSNLTVQNVCGHPIECRITLSVPRTLVVRPTLKEQLEPPTGPLADAYQVQACEKCFGWWSDPEPEAEEQKKIYSIIGKVLMGL